MGFSFPGSLDRISQIIQQLSDSSGKEVTSAMIWETFRAEYLESQTEIASGPAQLGEGQFYGVCKMFPITTGAGQIEMFVAMVGKVLETSLRIVTQRKCHTVSQNKRRSIVFLEMWCGRG